MKGNNHSVVKTIRFPSDLDQYLIEEARRNNQTTSAFITFIIMSYKNRYQPLENLNSLAIRPSSMSLFINSIDDNTLIEIGEAMSSDVIVHLSRLITPPDNVDWLNWNISEFLPSVNWYNCFKSSKGCIVTHHMGRKWTIFLQSFLRSLIDKYPGEKPVIEVDGDVILLKPRKNHSSL